MKKFFPIALLLSVFVMNARQFSPEEAKTFAQDFLKEKSIKTRDASERDLTLVNQDSDKPYYAFNMENSLGFVVVSSYGENPMVLGYADKGKFDIKNLPPQLKGILENGAPVKEKPAVISTRTEGDGVLYATVDWGQWAPFNNLCPDFDDHKAPAGCVATAMAIAMQYHKWPEFTHGGKEFNYYHPDHIFDFDNYTIDWDALSDASNPKFADEASKLTFSLGVVCPMIYGSNESEAEVWPVSQKMIQYFYYSKDCQYIPKDAFKDSEWNAMLKQQLDEVGPVIYNGGSSPGHCFVIDGYNNEGYYHVNWGWEGSSNGYWALDFSDVGGLDFSNYQGMIINIKPDYGLHEYSKLFIPNVDAFLNPETNIWNFSTPDIIPGEPTQVKSPFIVLNKMSGYFTLGVVDEDDNVVQLVEGDYWNSTNERGTYCAYPGTDPLLNFRFPGLKDGQRYQWVSYEMNWPENYEYWADPYPETDLKDWKLVLGGILKPSYFYDKGNFSYLVDIDYHIEENLPVFMDFNNTIEKEFSQKKLWGGDGAENYYGPNGLTYEVKAKDRDGNSVEAIYVMTDEGFAFTTNISVYQHHYDVYVGYYNYGNTRHDNDINPNEIEIHDGLVFKLMNDKAALIGYENIGEKIEIPAYIKSDGIELPVKNIELNSLLFAPVKDLTINFSQIDSIKPMSFAGMKDLERVSIQNYTTLTEDGLWREYGYAAHTLFLDSKVKEVFIDAVPHYNEMILISGLNTKWDQNFNKTLTKVWNNNIDYYFNPLQMETGLNDLFDNFSQFYNGKEWLDGDRFYKSVNVPGLGKSMQSQEIDNLEIPYNELWGYSVDKDNGLLLIDNIDTKVKIKNVSVNGHIVERNTDGLYEVPDFDGESFEVSVAYTLNEDKHYETKYSYNYNLMVENSNLGAGINEILGNGSKSYIDVYNLQGVRVIKNANEDNIRTLSPGIYIIDGKKIVVK